jgi:hypothetical protein
VAWTERSNNGNSNLYVQTTADNGVTWQLVSGGSLNQNASTGWAFHPRLATDGTNLYLSWEEQANMGQPSQLYVQQWNGVAWSSLGTALNSDPVHGSAMHSSIAVLNGEPVLAWNEIQTGQLMQTYMKGWNGSAWTTFIGPGR